MPKRSNLSYGLNNPFQKIPPQPIVAQRAPTANDTNYEIASLWIDQPTDDVYTLTNVTAGAATWVISSTGTGILDTLTGDAGGAIAPDATHTITLAGGTNIGTTGAGNTITFNLDAAISLATSVTSPLYTTTAADMDINAAAGQDIDVTLGDAVGANNFSWFSSTPALVASMDSLGQLVNTNVECGTNLARITEYTSNLSVIQAFADDDTASGGSVRSAIYGNMQPTAGDGNSTPNAIWGSLDHTAGANTLQVNGVYGLCTQEDGSVIASTAAGVEGHLNLLETGNADLPAVYAFAVKGYLDSVDTAGVPAGIVAGVGSVVEYNTPFDGKAYGVAVTRLDAGAGAGTAGLAAFGVVQGTVAAADWLYGLDLYNGAAGVAYTNADIRLQNQSTIAVDTEGVTFSGDVAARSLNATNIDITFNQSPLVQSNVNTGGVPTGVAGDINLIHLQDGSVMEEFVITAQAILAPRMTATGLEIGGDQIATNGWEYNWGVDANRRFAFVSQTSPAFFIEARLDVATVANVAHLWLGFRINAANNANYALYTDGAFIGLHPATNPATAIIAQSLNGPGWAYTNTTDAFANATPITLRVNVSAAGVITYQINGAAPTAIPAVQTFDAADVIIPSLIIVQGAAAFTPVKLISLKVGYSDWY